MHIKGNVVDCFVATLLAMTRRPAIATVIASPKGEAIYDFILMIDARPSIVTLSPG